MNKYVCDYEQVNKAAKLLLDAAQNMKSCTNKYSKSINADLSKWEEKGIAKTAFSSSNDRLVEMMNSYAEYLEALGEFVKDASKKIDAQDKELAEMNI